MEPHTHTVPSPLRAIDWLPPAATAFTPLMPAICSGAITSLCLAPTCNEALEPQPHTVPSDLRARECDPPAAIIGLDEVGTVLALTSKGLRMGRVPSALRTITPITSRHRRTDCPNPPEEHCRPCLGSFNTYFPHAGSRCLARTPNDASHGITGTQPGRSVAPPT